MIKRYLFLLIIAAGCATESSVGPAKAPTFVRYFNTGFDDEAEGLLETADKKGLVILANTLFPPSTANPSTRSKVTLIKTDEFGNRAWQKFYPDSTENKDSYKGFGINRTADGGYVIVGEVIQVRAQSGTVANVTTNRLLFMTVDADGNNPIIKIMNYPDPIRGRGVDTNAAGNFIVLATVLDQGAKDNILLTELSKPTLAPAWTRFYGAGEQFDNALLNLSLPNKLFVDGSGNSFWSGTVRNETSKNYIRIIQVPTNASAITARSLSDPAFDEICGDIIRVGLGYGILGTVATSGDSTRISVRRLTENGEVLSRQSYSVKVTGGNGNLKGNSLCVAQDGALVVLGTVGSTTGTDYCLLKVDAFGSATPIWTRVLGGRFDDAGKSVITTADGGHVVLGTTTLANVKTILLMKTDKEGKIPGL